jgi:hypothetical protein
MELTKVQAGTAGALLGVAIGKRRAMKAYPCFTLIGTLFLLLSTGIIRKM